ncbi:MAG: RHS repeat-associated core domain-containing protein [Lysobacteraceae bacterium]
MALLFSWASVAAQDMTLRREYGEVVKSAETIGALGDDLFGDQTNLYTGSTEFAITDVSLPGTGLVPVSLGRRYPVEEMSGLYGPGQSDPVFVFGDWELDVPHLYGIFSRRPGYYTGESGWSTGNTDPNQRCTVANASIARPDYVLDAQTLATLFAPSEYWHGNSLHIPGGGDQEMLVITAQNTQHPTDGKTYYWTTSDGWYFSCLSSLASGEGEGFLAIDPNGTRYWFNWMVEWDHPRITKGHGMAPIEPSSFSSPSPSKGEAGASKEELVYNLAFLPRKKVAIYPTKIEDRFGNTVTYTWNSTYKHRLETITADDGRTISLTYTAGGQVDTVTAGTRTWDYTYTSDKLTEVELPDTSTWQYSLTALESLYTNDNPTTEAPDCWGAIMSSSQTAKTGTITHPSGAMGTFTFRPTEHGRSFVDDSGSNCVATSVPAPGGGFHTIWIAIHPWLFSSPSLEKKVITGVGLPAAGYEWTYNYGDPNNSKASCTGTCPDTKQVTVITKDDGTAVDWARYTFSNRYQQGEGKLEKTELGSSAGNILRTINQTWQLDPIGQPYPARLGESPFRRSDRSAEKHAPLKQRDIVQQSRTFTWEATAWNLYAAPVEVDKYSTLGYTRTEKTTYRHDTSLWVLNQVSKLENLSEATVDTEIGYDATCALPTTTKRFGKLVETKSWNCATGNLDWVQDGAGATHRTEFSNYQRGIPKRIDFADGEWMSAVMDSNGQISSVNDQFGYTTGYEYDGMGRLKKVTYPGSDTVAWATRNLTFAPVGAEYGLAAGHWRRTETAGTHRIETAYDALWRPLVVREWDTAAEASTRRVTVTRYDHAGRAIYSSYPRNSATTSYLGSYDGVDTTYDSLGRITGTLQASELGTDPVTTIEYLSGFKTRFTNARSEPTTTGYYAWDEPTTEFPKDSVEPEGVTTTVYRDSWGKPTYMRRNGSYTPPGGSAEAYDLRRYYVYDAYERLCKTREPDAGITVMDYDSAGNIAWQAKGRYSLTSTSSCQSGSVLTGDKSTYHYDALNRVLAINHPSGTDDVGYTYFDDGAMQTATVGVLSGTSPVSWSSKHNEWTYTYNKRRLQETATLAIDGKSFQLNPTYNSLGHVSSLVYPSGYTISYAPNALGQPTKAANGGMNLASTASYYPNGAMAGFTYGNGITRTVTLNTRQLPGRILDQYGGTKTLDHTLTYDANANLKSITDGVNGQETRTLGYDGRDRLTSVTGAPSGNESFTYDPLDRIRRITATGRDDRYKYSDPATGGSTYRLDRIHPAGKPTLGTSYTWNTRGELTGRTHWFEGTDSTPGEGYVFGHGFEDALTPSVVPFTYDRAGRLTSVYGATVQYDAHGHRVKNFDPPGYTRYHVYDQGGMLRYQEDGYVQKRKEYVDLNGTLVAEREQPLAGGSTTTSYLHTDERRSTTVRTASNRAVQYRRPFDAYGEPSNGQWLNGPGFAGHEMEEVGNLVYMRQRYYDPAGFFISPDPIAASRVDFNPFAYARNNPYSFIDPDGRQSYGFGTNQPDQILGCHSTGTCDPTGQRGDAIVAHDAKVVAVGQAGTVVAGGAAVVLVAAGAEAAPVVVVAGAKAVVQSAKTLIKERRNIVCMVLLCHNPPGGLPPGRGRITQHLEQKMQQVMERMMKEMEKKARKIEPPKPPVPPPPPAPPKVPRELDVWRN